MGHLEEYPALQTIEVDRTLGTQKNESMTELSMGPANQLMQNLKQNHSYD